MKRRDLFKLLPGLPAISMPKVEIDSIQAAAIETAQANATFWEGAVKNSEARMQRGDKYHNLEFANVNWLAAKERLLRLKS